MPCISIKHERNVKEVLNIPLKNKNFLDYQITSISEIIKF